MIDEHDGYFDGYDAAAWLRRTSDTLHEGKCVLFGEACPRCHLAIPSWPRMIAAEGQRHCRCPRLDGDPVTVDVFGDLMPRHGLGHLAPLFGIQIVPNSPLA